MNDLPLFDIISNDAVTSGILGDYPETRFFPFGEAPSGVSLPYAVYQTIVVSPSSPLNCRGDVELHSVQIDCYAKTGREATALCDAIQGALELHAEIEAIRDMSRDAETRNYRFSIDVNFLMTGG